MLLLLWYGTVRYGMVWYGLLCYWVFNFSWLWKPVCLLWLAGGLSGCLPGWLAALAGGLFVSSRRFQQPTKSNDLQTVPVA